MVGLSGLTPTALGSSLDFNWPWFVELVTCGILVIWFFFYMNRLFATVISYAIRTYTWHKFRVYIDIKSLQLSLLGGRLFFKGIRYHGENESIFVHNGHITWRYWLNTTKQVDLGHDTKQEKTSQSRKTDADFDTSGSTSEESIPNRIGGDIPSRIVVSITGLEWFIYNRTPVYDAIVSEFHTGAHSTAVDADRIGALNAFSQAIGNKLKRRTASTSDSKEPCSESTTDLEQQEKTKSTTSDSRPQSPADSTCDRDSNSSEPDPSCPVISSFYTFMLRFFPVGIECTKGAISIGNENTKALLVTTFQKAWGHVDAAASGPADIFRQVFDFNVDHPVAQLKPNPDYNLPQMALAERVITGHASVLVSRPWWKPRLSAWKTHRSLNNTIKNLLPRSTSSVASLHSRADPHSKDSDYTSFLDARPDSHEWHGLDRYIDEDEADDHLAWMNIEYARFSTLLDSPHVHLRFYWDTPGLVELHHVTIPSGLAAQLNGIEPPAYGLDLDVYGGMVNYGPWSDRLRAEIQNMFLPSGYKVAQPKQPLTAGESRLSTVMHINIDIKAEITLRIPSRESSKDWRWRGRATAVKDAAAVRRQQQRKHFRFRRLNKRRIGPDVRPFGWIAVSTAAGSKVKYVMDMYAGNQGYHNTLQVSLLHTKATSSVNHNILWQCHEQQVSADLSNPLAWNDLHTWRFDVMSNNMDLYLLRDHTFLLIDLISDFTAGQKSDYLTFMPFNYAVGVKFLDLRLFLNANDNNIIDDPCDPDDNTFLILAFSRLVGTVDIPLQYFSPSQNSIAFQGNGQDATLSLKTPAWHTLHAFGDENTMATLKTLTLDGAYNYFSKVDPSLTESLVLSISGGTPSFNLQGFLIRYFMNVKDNYFGDTINFSTLEEYQARIERKARGEEEKRPPPKKQNDLDVILSVRTDNASATMPANIYRTSENVRLDVLLIEADMRFTNYYMDLSVVSSPVEVSTESRKTGDNGLQKDTSNCQLFIDGATIYGHRLFGAPPSEPTYLCNWDFDVGDILGQCTSGFVQTLSTAILSFIFTMDDDENALPKSVVELIPDVTFLRANLSGVKVWVLSAETAFLVELSKTSVELNDWANMHFSQYVKVNVPRVRVAAIDSISAHRARDAASSEPLTHACVQTSLNLAVVSRKADFTRQTALQQAHIRFHDSKTHRASWLIHEDIQPTYHQRRPLWSQQVPSMPAPPMPEPLQTLRGSTSPRIRASTPKSEQRSMLKPECGHTKARPSSFLTSETPMEKQAVAFSELGNASNRHYVSSRWRRPVFHLQEVEPDLRYMPSTHTKFRPRSQAPLQREDDSTFETLHEAFKHDGVFCELIDGVHGFCTPDAITAVLKLISELAPKTPESLLDDLQMQVNSDLKQLSSVKQESVNDLAFRCPASILRIVNPHASLTLQPNIDLFDARWHSCKATVRLEPEKDKQMLRSRTLLHISLQEFGIDVYESGPQVDVRTSRAEVQLKDANLWLALGTKIRARAQLDDLDVSMPGKDLESLVGLVERIESVVAKLLQQAHFGFDNTLQRLLYILVQTDQSSASTFLARPVNILRAAEEHVRLHDSWKTICQLRVNLRAMVKEENDELFKSQQIHDKSSTEIRKQVSSALEHWKTWELTASDNRVLLKAIFGGTDTSSFQDTTIDTELEILLARANLTVDPGPTQSHFILDSLDLSYSEKLSVTQAKRWTQHHAAPTLKSLQVYCGTFDVLLHWELLHLAERMLQVSLPHLKKSSEDALPETTKSEDTITMNNNIVVVIGADAASLELRSPNVLLQLGTERFKTCFTSEFQAEDRMMMSLVLGASSGRLRVRSQQVNLIGCKVASPNIFFSAQKDRALFSDHVLLRAVAATSKLRIHIKQDILSLLQTAQAFIQNEVSDIQKLVNVLPSNPKPPELAGRSPNSNRFLPHVMLVLEDYLIQWDVMPCLRYKLTGTTARTSVIPADNSRFSVSLDIKENAHSFDNPSAGYVNGKSRLNMPPMSVFLTCNIRPGSIDLGARGTVERMLLEASAVRACFDAAYRPETMGYIKDVQSAIDQIQQSQKSEVPKVTKTYEEKDAPLSKTLKLRYNVSLVFEGIRLHCHAPAARTDQEYAVNLDLLLSTTTMQMTNVTDRHSALVNKPNFDFILPQLSLHLGRTRSRQEHFGYFSTGLHVSGFTERDETGKEVQNFRMTSSGANLDMFAETIVLGVDLIAFLQSRIKSLAAAEDAKKLRPLRRLTLANNRTSPKEPAAAPQDDTASENSDASTLLSSTFSVNLDAICLRWLTDRRSPQTQRYLEDLVFSVRHIELSTTREASARLTFKALQLQLVPRTAQNAFERTANSALLPEVIFNAAYARATDTRKFAFKAAGNTVDVQLASNFAIPASAVQRSLALASRELRTIQSSSPSPTTETTSSQLPQLMGNKRLANLLVFADFAGAQVTVSPAQTETVESSSAFGFLKGNKRSRAGRYGQAVANSAGEAATLQAPGIAFRVEYVDDGLEDPSLSTEIRVAASSNTLAPSVVPLILEISSSVSDLLDQDNHQSAAPDTEAVNDKALSSSLTENPDPVAILGRVKLNAGLWVQRQEFSLTCQPIARVSATAQFEEIFVVINTVQPKEQDRFFSITTTFRHLTASVQHVYSRESTANLTVDSVMISLMNSKHFSGKSGISAIANISPVHAYLNAKQMQDFMLFREIWYPEELRSASTRPAPSPSLNKDTGPVIQKFQQATTTSVLPWHAIFSLQGLEFALDLGQSIGKCQYVVGNLWASSKKSSDSEQNLCVGFDRIGMESTGRMSGFVELQGFRVRTAIRWPLEDSGVIAPLVQGSIGFEHLRAKAVFDYQPFAVADISSFDFLMYNVREPGGGDRLVAILDGGKVQAFFTSLAAAQALSIHQAFERLIQEKKEAFEVSLHELDRHLRRKSTMPSSLSKLPESPELTPRKPAPVSHAPKLNVDVVITIKAIDAGVFMSSFFDETTFKLAAVDVQARFAVGETNRRTQSGLGMQLGQVRLALSNVSRPNTKALGETSVNDVIERATAARGGTILKVPRLIASMQTWQQNNSNTIEYVFHSVFQGKVDVGWNYSRISTIRRMWDNHSRALAQKMNKPLSQSAIKITAEPKDGPEGEGKEKITAVVHMPQSKYEYIALEPPVIDTPQLRDLGEATPSLEWIGLQRDRLPHATHSVIIVSLLEIAKEVEDTYARILGSN